MRAALLPAFGGPLELCEVPDPVPANGEVVVDVVACGAGLTLEHVRNGKMGGAPPFIMGHEFAGRISALGENVDGWSLGDRVTATFYLTCGYCDMCAGGHETLCRNFRGWIGAARDGAFAERVSVPARNLVRVPAGSVAVIGAGGGLGAHTLGVVRAFGGRAIAIERDAAKLAELGRRQLATIVIDARDADWHDQLRALLGGGVDAVIDTFGSSETLAAGAAILAPLGTLVILGLTAGAKLSLDPAALLIGEHAVVGTRYCSRAEIAASLELVAAEQVPTLIGARYPLDAINHAFAAIRENKVFGRILIDVAPE